MSTKQKLQSYMAGALMVLAKTPSQDVDKFLKDFKAVHSKLRADLDKNVLLSASIIALELHGDHLSVPVSQEMIDAIENMISERGDAERGDIPTEEMVTTGANSVGGSDGNLLQLTSGSTLWFEGVANGRIIASDDMEATPRALSLSVVREINLDDYVLIKDMSIDSGEFGAGTIFKSGEELYYRSRHSSLDLYIVRPLGKSAPVYLSRK